MSSYNAKKLTDINKPFVYSSLCILCRKHQRLWLVRHYFLSGKGIMPEATHLLLHNRSNCD